MGHTKSSVELYKELYNGQCTAHATKDENQKINIMWCPGLI